MTWTHLTDLHSQNVLPLYQTDSVKYRLDGLGPKHLDKLPPRPFGFYAITRFNPLFIEESDHEVNSSDLIRNVLMSVSLGRYRGQTWSLNGLTPVLKNKIDSVPRSAWSQDKSRQFHEEEEDSVEHQTRKSNTLCIERKSLCRMLRELSDSIESAADLPAQIVLHSLRDKTNRLQNFSPPTPAAKRHFSRCELNNVGDDDEVAAFGRVLRLVKKYNDERRTRTPSSSHFYHYPTTQESASSSSSAASTSGFSDLTQTPTSSNSSFPEFPDTSQIILENNNLVRAVVNERAYRNDSICKTLRCIRAASDTKKSVSFSSFQYRIVPNNRAGYSVRCNSSAIRCIAQFEDNEIKNAVDNINRSDSLLSSFPGRRCPDFTLDVHQVEKVNKEIEDKEKERCWCRIITSCAGFVLLLFSVMFFSFVLTKGERIFGSL